MEKVIFPDVEKVLVAGIKAALAERNESYALNVLVATKKPAPDFTPYPARIVTIRSDGGPQLDDVRKQERLGIHVWADTYSDASDLARLLEALLKQMTGEEIKLVEIALSPVRVDEEGPQECRFMTIQVITKGVTL
jgi:hypothetical protein